MGPGPATVTSHGHDSSADGQSFRGSEVVRNGWPLCREFQLFRVQEENADAGQMWLA
jgi:hypothetical protein